jgi:osmoprotectant transport system permease protein
MRLAVILLAVACGSAQAQALKVGSKRFTESYILGEIVSLSAGGTHQPGLGNTAILLEALKSGAIDVYPEYTGTIAREILKSEERLDLAQINRRLAAIGLAASVPLGFSNSYALGMRRKDAERLGVMKVSQLAKHAQLRFGLSHEFLGRRDGWPGLQAAYGLPQRPRGLDHGIAYEALAAGEIDVMDLYTTDAKIERYAIVALEDDRRFFPPYEAVLLYRSEVAPRIEALKKLQGSIDTGAMVRLNARAELDKVPFADVAREFLGSTTGKRSTFLAALFAPDFGRLLLEHLGLVFGSVAVAALVGVPLGVLAAKVRGLAQPVLVSAGLLQTIPSLALLAILIPLTGSIGLWPALIALFLYALLPITRNAHAGLLGVPAGLVQAGTALGLSRGQVLRRVEMPLALPVIMAGVKTSAVINVGTATIAAFIGAGGFGERITQGLALNDHAVLLAGALPAAALALLVHVLFEWVERRLTVK